jgi:hypothetical protein
MLHNVSNRVDSMSNDPSTMSQSAHHPTHLDSEQADAEIQMRKTLGIPPPGRQRFTGSRSDRLVVVEHRGGSNRGRPVNRVAEAEAALAGERKAREQAMRALRDAQAALREAETKRGHAELARDEAMKALSVERRAREAVERQLQEKVALETSVAQAAPKPTATTSPIGKRGSRRPGSSTRSAMPAKAQESEPVRWWEPGWRHHR